MTNEEVDKVKLKYSLLLGTKKELMRLNIRKAELENKPEVREYLETLKYIDNHEDYFHEMEKLSDDEILDMVIDKFKPAEDNHIYTYVGKDEDTKLLKFKNIETAVVHNISIDNLDAFEEENLVMYPIKDYQNDYEKFYKLMRRNYYKKIVDNYSDRLAVENASRYSYWFSRQKLKIMI